MGPWSRRWFLKIPAFPKKDSPLQTWFCWNSFGVYTGILRNTSVYLTLAKHIPFFKECQPKIGLPGIKSKWFQPTFFWLYPCVYSCIPGNTLGLPTSIRNSYDSSYLSDDFLPNRADFGDFNKIFFFLEKGIPMYTPVYLRILDVHLGIPEFQWFFLWFSPCDRDGHTKVYHSIRRYTFLEKCRYTSCIPPYTLVHFFWPVCLLANAELISESGSCKPARGLGMACCNETLWARSLRQTDRDSVNPAGAAQRTHHLKIGVIVKQ